MSALRLGAKTGTSAPNPELHHFNKPFNKRFVVFFIVNIGGHLWSYHNNFQLVLNYFLIVCSWRIEFSNYVLQLSYYRDHQQRWLVQEETIEVQLPRDRSPRKGSHPSPFVGLQCGYDRLGGSRKDSTSIAVPDIRGNQSLRQGQRWVKLPDSFLSLSQMRPLSRRGFKVPTPSTIIVVGASG